MHWQHWFCTLFMQWLHWPQVFHLPNIVDRPRFVSKTLKLQFSMCFHTKYPDLRSTSQPLQSDISDIQDALCDAAVCAHTAILVYQQCSRERFELIVRESDGVSWQGCVSIKRSRSFWETGHRPVCVPHGFRLLFLSPPLLSPTLLLSSLLIRISFLSVRLSVH